MSIELKGLKDYKETLEKRASYIMSAIEEYKKTEDKYKLCNTLFSEEERERNYRRGYRDGYISACNDARVSKRTNAMLSWALNGKLLAWTKDTCAKLIWPPSFEDD